MIKFDFKTYTEKFIDIDELKEKNDINALIKSAFDNRYGMMGWHNLDNLFNQDLIADITKTASYIRDNCDIFLVLGIGGSYLGSFAAIEALNSYFYNYFDKPKIYFVGTSLSTDYYNDLSKIIEGKDIIINVISKSGTTYETSIAYQWIKKIMDNKYSEEEIKKRLIITTDKERGHLRAEVNAKGYKSYIIPNDIGGRYSIFSPVGLLPIAVSGVDLNELYIGAKEANDNMAKQAEYALVRDAMLKRGKVVEAYTVYEPKLQAFTEWLKQLYGESLGKEGKGIFPASFINTRDLHSLGQFIQDGNEILFETVINVRESKKDLYLDNIDISLSEINSIASLATSKAHYKGDVLNNIITIDMLDAKTLGYLFQFFMTSCVISAYLEGVNPFNQDGVEEYKKIMHQLLDQYK